MNCASRPPAQQQQQQTLGLLSAHISSAHVFLDASTHLRKSVCRSDVWSVGRSIHPFVCPSVRMSRGNRPETP